MADMSPMSLGSWRVIVRDEEEDESKAWSITADSGRIRSTRSRLAIKVSMDRLFSAERSIRFSTTKYRTIPILPLAMAIPSNERPLLVKIGV